MKLSGLPTRLIYQDEALTVVLLQLAHEVDFIKFSLFSDIELDDFFLDALDFLRCSYRTVYDPLHQSMFRHQGT